jgi:uncharacterized protein (TIGR03437 family)
MPRSDSAICGTNRERSREEVFLHRQSMRNRARALRSMVPLEAAPSPAAARDIGNIAVIEDSDGVVARQNQFNLDQRTVRFTPSQTGSGQYRYEVTDSAYDTAATASGAALNGLGDDDTLAASLPFSFPFFGSSYTQVYINSDGNLTFGAGDKESTDRSLGRMTAGPPRLSPLFDDLDPSKAPGSVRVLSDSSRFVVTWVAVPEYAQYGTGPTQTFQVALYPDGRIEFSYTGAAPSNAVVGIAPGNLAGSTSLVSFRNDPSADYSSTVAERFGDTLAVDMVSVAQKFFQTHEDSYDYLAVFNNMDIPAGPTAVAYENTVRDIERSGYGDTNLDFGFEYGSASRLQAVLNLGPLSQYPRDPASLVPARRAAGDTPLSIIAHETGHLFLAFASVRDPNDPTARPMLGAQLAHWSFLFNSEASLLEGERIRDDGPGVSPRFTTTDTVQAYAPLDQYLMGFRMASEVPPSFYVTGPPSYIAQQHPLRGYGFDGDRVDVTVDDVIRAEGARIPDHTVAQRRFRFAFILIVAKGTDPKPEELAQLETYRSQFEPFYSTAASNRATADATLKRSLKFSLFPAAGTIVDSIGIASLTLAAAPESDLTINLNAPNGIAAMPASVTIPAGAKSASFAFTGMRIGVEDVTAVPADSTYETAFARVQVVADSTLRLEALSGDQQIVSGPGSLPDPIVVRVTDDNRLPYPGLRVDAVPSADGSVEPVTAIIDASGRAAFSWTPGSAATSQLQIAVEGAPGLNLTIHAGSSILAVTSVTNGASGAATLAPGAVGTIAGVNLSDGARVLLGTRVLPSSYTRDRKINFYIPPDVSTGSAILTVQPLSGPPATARVALSGLAPGIFVDSGTGFGAVHPAGSVETTAAQPVVANDFIEIHCTGLGPTRTVDGYERTVYQPAVYIAGIPAPVVSSRISGMPGNYQIQAQVPFGVSSGVQSLVVRMDTVSSNAVPIWIR